MSHSRKRQGRELSSSISSICCQTSRGSRALSHSLLLELVQYGLPDTQGQVLVIRTSVGNKLCSKMAEGIQRLEYLQRNLLLVVSVLPLSVSYRFHLAWSPEIGLNVKT
jgi:hypothetical protein